MTDLLQELEALEGPKIRENEEKVNPAEVLTQIRTEKTLQEVQKRGRGRPRKNTEQSILAAAANPGGQPGSTGANLPATTTTATQQGTQGTLFPVETFAVPVLDAEMILFACDVFGSKAASFITRKPQHIFALTDGEIKRLKPIMKACADRLSLKVEDPFMALAASLVMIYVTRRPEEEETTTKAKKK